MSENIQYGESMTREGLPEEVMRRVLRRADAEQNRHMNLARIADALGDDTRQAKTLHSIDKSLARIADALERLIPVEAEETAEAVAISEE